LTAGEGALEAHNIDHQSAQLCIKNNVCTQQARRPISLRREVEVSELD
jgi:hypothetical protein